MREIKFRGKRKDNGEWVYGDLLKPFKSQFYVLDYSKFDYDCFEHIGEVAEEFEVIPETVGQFTGLKDKNGKEVYEGDILRIPPKDKYEEHTYNSFEVFYHDNDCSPTDCGLVFGRLKPHGNSAGGYSGYKLIPKHISAFVVIDNIHDNPELLKE